MTQAAATAGAWPTQLRYRRGARTLEIAFDDGLAASLSAELLRVESPSAEVRGHGPGQRQLLGGKAQVGIRRIEPVGRYAVRLVFDDGHDSGLYSWPYLHQLAREAQPRWSQYLALLAAHGLSRDAEGSVVLKDR